MIYLHLENSLGGAGFAVEAAAGTQATTVLRRFSLRIEVSPIPFPSPRGLGDPLPRAQRPHLPSPPSPALQPL